MGMLVDGQWVDRWYQADDRGRFVRPPTRFHGWVGGGNDAPFPLAAGRYHLFVSYACPWAHRTLIMRALKGLDDAVGVTVVAPHMGADGWALPDDALADPSPVDVQLLREVYLAADPDYTGRVTVPVLWDTETGTIINNESREILRSLDHDFAPLARHGRDFAPPRLLPQVEAAIDAIYEPINNGVYRAGFAGSQSAYDEAVAELFAALDAWDRTLGRQRYVCGDELSEADVCLFTTLYRFDAVYHVHFKCSRRRLIDYPNLWAFVRDIYQTPGVAATCRMDHIREHYYTSHETLNPKRIVAAMPQDADFAAPHGRGAPPALD